MIHFIMLNYLIFYSEIIVWRKKTPSIRIEELKASGSWTVFLKETSHAEAVKY